MNSYEQNGYSSSDPQKEQLQVPDGFRLIRTLDGHTKNLSCIQFDQNGERLCTASADSTARVWDASSGRLLETLAGDGPYFTSVAIRPDGLRILSGSADGIIRIWEMPGGRLVHAIKAHNESIRQVAFSPDGLLVSASKDGLVKFWSETDGRLVQALTAHAKGVLSIAFNGIGEILATSSRDSTVRLWRLNDLSLTAELAGHQQPVHSISFAPDGKTIASASADRTVKIWEVSSGTLLTSLESHTHVVHAVAFSPDGTLLASKSADGTLCLWKTEPWELIAILPEPTLKHWWVPTIAFHPTLPQLAIAAIKTTGSEKTRMRGIHIWEWAPELLQQQAAKIRFKRVEHYTTAKIVLVGDSGVGKTGLGWRIANGQFKEHSSTHGQQFWLLNQLSVKRQDGTECEAVLWDLAGQPDYRLIHALFLDDADLALVLFDPTDSRDPLRGVEFWIKQLHVARSSLLKTSKLLKARRAECQIVLVAARTDRGNATLTSSELDTFCRERKLSGWIATSALGGEGIDELIERMKALVAWERKPATITTATFKRIKDYVLALKEDRQGQSILVNLEELRLLLQQTDLNWQFTNREIVTAVGHLQTYGYVKWLRTSKGEMRILLAPELLNNLAASFVLEARRNQDGLGALREAPLLAGAYPFRELDGLSESERDVLLDSAALLFLENNVAFRERDPLTTESYLVFPELINLKKPLLEDNHGICDGVAYTVSGPVENVHASLVVLLGYTQTFTRRNQWQNHARYEVGDGLVCGFRLDRMGDGELEFVLYYGKDVGHTIRALFQSLFESFLARRNLTVTRFDPVQCPHAGCGNMLDRAVLRTRLREGKTFAFCNDCGERLILPTANQPIQMTRREQAEVENQQRLAVVRTRFEQAIFRVHAYVKEQNIPSPECFISYAWGEPEEERWVERNLAADLLKAGISVLLDRWENAKIGSSVPRFVERIAKSDRVIVIGTPLYRRKYDNGEPMRGFVVAAEGELIGMRMIGTEKEKASVLPTLRAGAAENSLPPLLQGRVYADFRDEQGYFATAFNLILSIYGIPPNAAAVADLRESISGGGRAFGK